MQLTELTFNYPSCLGTSPGRIFRSAMPFSAYDPSGDLIDAYHQAGISVIVLLASDEECQNRLGRDLRGFYQNQGWEVIYYPIPDFNVPAEPESFNQVLDETTERVVSGKNVVVHCNAGLGRTGIFLACLAKKNWNYTAEQAIEWVRKFIPEAVENPVQYQYVIDH